MTPQRVDLTIHELNGPIDGPSALLGDDGRTDRDGGNIDAVGSLRTPSRSAFPNTNYLDDMKLSPT